MSRLNRSQPAQNRGAELEFLRHMRSLMEREPREPVSASRVARGLDLAYDDALKVIERLGQSGYVQIAGDGRILSLMRVRLTRAGSDLARQQGS